MPTLLPSAEQQFCDGNGAPLAGGLVFFYLPSTTVAKDTWQDPGGQIKNQNPVVLDGDGRAIIYGTGSYRQVLKDASGNLIWDQVTADTSSSGASWAGVSTGTGTNITLSAPNFASVDGQAIDFILGVSLTGAAQATINGTAVPLKLDTLSGPVQTSAGSAIAGNRYRVTYDAIGGVLHLSASADRPYVDAGVAAAEAFAVAQASSALAQAETYAANADTVVANNAAAGAAAAAASALSQAEAFASNADAVVASNAAAGATAAANSALSQAQAYAAAQATQAVTQAESFATNADAAVTANCNAAAQTYAVNQAAGALAVAKSYSDGQLASAQTSNASTYITGVRLSGFASLAAAGRGSGMVCTTCGSSSGATYAHVQYNVGGNWVNISDA